MSEILKCGTGHFEDNPLKPSIITAFDDSKLSGKYAFITHQLDVDSDAQLCDYLKDKNLACIITDTYRTDELLPHLKEHKTDALIFIYSTVFSDRELSRYTTALSEIGYSVADSCSFDNSDGYVLYREMLNFLNIHVTKALGETSKAGDTVYDPLKAITYSFWA